MTSVILSAATRLIFPLMLLFSIFLLLRGHNEPGGGFVGGLVAAAAFALYAFATDVERAREAVRVDTIRIIGSGLTLALLSGLVAIFDNRPFLTAIWTEIDLPVIGILNTALMFDFGVYLVVIGVALTIVFAMAEAENEEE